MARPSKRSPERVERICDALRSGNTRRAACLLAGIGEATFFRWLNEDQEFRETVERAEAQAEARFVAQVESAALGGTWTAAAWWLERRRPADYARRDKVDSRVELSGPNGGPVETVATLSDHEKRALREAIRAHLAAIGEPVVDE